jgi:hypothetical protein
MASALSFNGTTAYVNLSNRSTSVVDNFTIIAWIKPNLPQTTGFVYYNGNDSGGWGMAVGNTSDGSGSKLVGLYGTIAWIQPDVNLTNGVWQHVAMVRRSGTVYFYLNGVETASVTNTPNTPTSGRATIGGQLDTSNNPQRYYNGILDEVKVYNRAYSGAEIVSDYNGGQGTYGLSSDSGIVGGFHMDEATGTTTADYSPTALTGTLTGSTLPQWVTGFINPPTTVSAISIAQRIEKRFYYKVYDSSQRYLTTWTKDVISDPNYRSTINGGSGQLMVRLARPFDNFGESSDVALRNKIELWVADADNVANNAASNTMWDVDMWDVGLWDSVVRSFIKMYSGYISAYAPVIDNEEQYVDVTVLGYVTETAMRILKDSSGNTTVTYTSQDPGAIMTDVIDKYRADGGVNLNYVGSSIQTVGVSATYTFKFNTIKECFDKILELCPAGWYYYIDANGTVYLQQSSDTADHVLTVGKEIIYMQPTKRIENIINQVYIIGGGGTPLFNTYKRDGSITSYGKFEFKIQDGSVTDNTTADLIAKAKLDQFETPETRTILRIADNNGEDSNLGTNIESFKVGDTIQIKNLNYGVTSSTLWNQGTWDTDVWDATLRFSTASVLTIVSIQYQPDYIEIEASTRLPEIARRIEQVNTTLNTSLQQNLPTNPTVRVV